MVSEESCDVVILSLFFEPLGLPRLFPPLAFGLDHVPSGSVGVGVIGFFFEPLGLPTGLFTRCKIVG